MHRMTLRDWQQHPVPEREFIASRIKKAHAFVRDQGDFVALDQLPEGDALVICHKNDGGTKYESWIFEEVAARPGHRYILAMINTDGPFRFEGPMSPNVVGVFTCNRISNAPGVVSVPLGVQDEKVPALRRARSSYLGCERTTLAYLNFTYNEEAHYNQAGRLSRAEVIRHFEAAPWARCEIRSVRAETPWEQVKYYEQLARSRFCISPEGNGIDTYRAWEALYLGAVPIVMDSVHLRSFSDLPIVYTTNYEECTQAMLEACYDDYLDREFDFSALMNSTYARRLRSMLSTLDHPTFALYSPDFLAKWGRYFR